MCVCVCARAERCLFRVSRCRVLSARSARLPRTHDAPAGGDRQAVAVEARRWRFVRSGDGDGADARRSAAPLSSTVSRWFTAGRAVELASLLAALAYAAPVRMPPQRTVLTSCLWSPGDAASAFDQPIDEIFYLLQPSLRPVPPSTSSTLSMRVYEEHRSVRLSVLYFSLPF